MKETGKLGCVVRHLDNKMPTFFDNNFIGWLTPPERSDLRYKAKSAAKTIMKKSGADHVVYEYVQYRNNEHEGTAHYYSGLQFSDSEFYARVASIPNASIGAFHRGTFSPKL